MSSDGDDWRSIQVLAGSAALAALGVGYYVSQQRSKNPFKVDDDQSSKTVIITGSNTGVGFATAKQCAATGAQVVLACRNEEYASQAISSIVKETGNKRVSFRQLDLTNFESIEKFVSNTKECDVLINNAGAMFKFQEFHLGIEKTMFTNYIGQFLLTKLMLPVLTSTSIKKNGAEVRVINIGSRSENLTNLGSQHSNRKAGSSGLEMCTTGPEPYGVWEAYGASKFCDLVSTFELHRRINRGNYSDINSVGGTIKGKANITVNAVTPGLCYSDLTRFGNPWVLWLTYPFRRFGLKTAEQGASGVVYVSLSKEFNGISGKYFSEGKELKSSEAAHSEALGKDLWIESERLINDIKGKHKK